MIGLVTAAVGAIAGLVFAATAWNDVLSDDFNATLGIVSILASLGAIPVGIVCWRWAERRREPSLLAQAAGLVGGATLLAWFAVLFYALSVDTP